MASASHSKGKRREGTATPLLEWIAAGIGAVLFAGALLVLGQEALAPDSEPRIETRLVETREQPGGWLLIVEVKNHGDEPAERVPVVVTLGPGEGAAEERREVHIDFIGPRSSRRAGVFVTRDPAGREIRIEPQGYLEP